MKLRAIPIVILCCLACLAVSAQAQSPDSVMRHIQAAAGGYPVRAVSWFAPDSAVIEVLDGTLTRDALKGGYWVFGSIPAEVLEGYPAQKALGRKLARVLWRERGKALGLRNVVVHLEGSLHDGRVMVLDWLYLPPELDAPWAADSIRTP